MAIVIICVLCIIIPAFYGYHARNGATFSDLLASTVLSLIVCIAIIFNIRPTQVGPVMATASLGLLIAAFSVFLEVRKGNSKASKAVKGNIQRILKIAGPLLVMIVAWVHGFFQAP